MNPNERTYDDEVDETQGVSFAHQKSQISGDVLEAADAICRGMIEHDRGAYADAAESFTVSDGLLFNVDDETASDAADAYVEALRAKDEVEATDDDLRFVSWVPVYEAFRQRAEAVELSPRYAEYTTDAWRAHKTGGDYWTPFLRAQQYVLQRAVGSATYPNKSSDGLNGAGPEPALYLYAVELHDQHEPWR